MLEKQKSGFLIAATAFVVLFGTTVWFWQHSADQSLQVTTQRFEFRNSDVALNIAQRLDQYEQVLIDGAAFMQGAENVDREDWRRYVKNLRLDERVPGIQGIGFSKVVAPDERQAIEARAQSEGHSGFQLWPEGERPVYTTILYLEPEDQRNERAIGYDMFSEPARRKAMQRARDTGTVSLTSTVELVQEDGTDPQAGFLMYYPVYASGERPASVADRRDQLTGYVYGAFRLGDLMSAVLGGRTLPYRRLQIFEGSEATLANRIFDSESVNSSRQFHEPLFNSTVPVQFNGHEWTLHFSSLPSFEASADIQQPVWILVAGTLFSLLMGALLWVLWTNQRRGWALSRASLRLLHAANQRESLKEELRQFFSISPDILCTLNSDGTFRQFNAACERILGLPSAELQEKRFVQTVHGDDKDSLNRNFAALRTQRLRRVTMELRNVTAKGEVRWIEWSFVAAEHENVNYGYGRDITDRKEMEQQLHYSAFHDKLTGAANRALLLDRLGHVIERSQRFGENYAIFLLDVDNFKSVNDSYGHVVGDKLLVAFTQRISNQLRPVDTCARFGGDEFTLLIEEAADEEGVKHLAQRILACMQKPFNVDGYEFYISSSIGIVHVNGNNTYESTEEVLKHADLALYEAKRQGKGRYILFDAYMQSEQLGKAQMESDLRHALGKQHMEVFYQPIVDLKANRIVGCEALVRWEHPLLGRVAPDKFIPVAESSGLITHLGRLVTETACREAAQWLHSGAVADDFFVSVNLSPKEFFLRDSAQFIQQMLDKYDLKGENLRVEVTEGVLIERDEEATRIFCKLQDMNVCIYIDDFGTGYSSLSYLRSLPVDGIKLDRSFVEQIRSTRKSQEIARTVVELARVLDLQAVVEGVETEEQLEFVRSLGFGYAQGFGLHCPMPAVEMNILMNSRQNPHLLVQ